ncbi:MAG: HAD-IB family phosphatase [Chloroflexota bacterium]|nr:HAD-IB family phosphatase [Chloroflexota bacterium]
MEAVERWLGYDDVFLDCDGTLVAMEGTDELARHKGMTEVIEQLTRQAMEGEARLENVYAERLRLLHPTRDDLRYVALRYQERAVSDARKLIAALKFLDRQVYIVSGGWAKAVIAFGNWLGISTDHIYAVELEFDELAGRWWEHSSGDPNPAERYLDFVPGPLSESEGKAAVISRVRQEPRRAMLVGDGIPDLLARRAVELFVGFGGVARRERVASEADVYVATSSLTPILPLVARPEDYDRCRNTSHQDVFDKGLTLIYEGDVTFRRQPQERSFHASYQAFYPRSN